MAELAKYTVEKRVHCFLMIRTIHTVTTIFSGFFFHFGSAHMWSFYQVLSPLNVNYLVKRDIYIYIFIYIFI